jgi:uncharacterized protein YunC (DUF1805 family)
METIKDIIREAKRVYGINKYQETMLDLVIKRVVFKAYQDGIQKGMQREIQNDVITYYEENYKNEDSKQP